MTEPKYAVGSLWGWRGFNIARDTVKGSQWRLVSPIAPTIGAQIPESFNPISPTTPSTCYKEKETELLKDIFRDMLKDVSSLVNGNEDIEKLVTDSLEMDFDILFDHGPVPSKDCSCGYYTYKHAEDFLREYNIGMFDAVGIVRLNGRIQRYSMGFRSEYISPHKIWVSPTAVSPGMSFSKRRHAKILAEVMDDLRRFYSAEIILAELPYEAPILDAYVDSSVYIPATEMPKQEIPKEWFDGQNW